METHGYAGDIEKYCKDNLPAFVVKSLSTSKVGVKILRTAPDSPLFRMLPFPGATQETAAILTRIEKIAAKTDALGKLPLWEGYENLEDYPYEIGPGALRSSHQVRTNRWIGAFYIWLVQQTKPELIVEFGTAFGVSGMYWLAGLELNQSGQLFTYEPNEIWAPIAHRNLAKISQRFRGHIGTFENHAQGIADEGLKIDLCLIDAIHTSAFVKSQLDIVLRLVNKRAVIVLDDIEFSEDMRGCWNELAADGRFLTALELGNVGILEVA